MNNEYQILKASIDILSGIVNLSTGLAHPLDESRAKELFIALHEKDIPLTRQEVYGLAIENSWPERHAKSLSELAQKIGNGGRVKVSHPRYWGEPTVERVMAELEQDSE